jgi:hypothetical protein
MHRAGHASPSATLRCQHAIKDRDYVLAYALAQLARSIKMSDLGRSVNFQNPTSDRPVNSAALSMFPLLLNHSIRESQGPSDHECVNFRL